MAKHVMTTQKEMAEGMAVMGPIASNPPVTKKTKTRKMVKAR